MKDRGRSNRLAVVVSWVVLLLAGAASVAPLVPPAAFTGVDATAFSAARAFDHIERIAEEPHPIGTPANQRVRADIVGRLRVLGLEAELQTIESPDYYGGPGDSVSVVNVLARIPGTASNGTVALVGHYDTVPTTPGANDDGSAVAIMLETARAIQAGHPLRNDVILLFTDGEEPAPRFGSSAFVAEHPWAGDLGFVINLEAVGSGGPSTLIEMNGPAGWIIDRYAEAVPHPVAFSFLTATTELIGGSNSDFASFRDEGIPGVELAYVHGSPIYHTPADAPDRVSLRSLQQQGANTLALTRHIGDLELGPSPRRLGRRVLHRWSLLCGAVSRLLGPSSHLAERGGHGGRRVAPRKVAPDPSKCRGHHRHRDWCGGGSGRCLDYAGWLARHPGCSRELPLPGRPAGADSGDRGRRGEADQTTYRHGARCYWCAGRLVGAGTAHRHPGPRDRLPVRVAGIGRRADAAVAIRGIPPPLVAARAFGVGGPYSTLAARPSD